MGGAATRPSQRNAFRRFTPAGATFDSEAWKSAINNGPIGGRFDEVSMARPGWSALFAGSLFQVALAAFAVLAPAFFPSRLVNPDVRQAIAIVLPPTQLALPAQAPIALRPTIIHTPPLVEQLPQRKAELIAPRSLVALRPKPARTESLNVPIVTDVPIETKFEAPVSGPVRPREPVKMGTLSSDGTARTAVNKNAAQVETGGFGPAGLSSTSDSASGAGGLKRTRGAVSSAGFGDGTAITSDSKGPAPRSVVKPGGFEAVQLDSRAPQPKQSGSSAGATVQPVTILSKPQPVYSDEARKLGLEGAVLLEVIFPASGPVQVVRVISGLGHGLDEAAVRAAQQIRFKPALEEGRPIDSPAMLHIEFQLAF